MSLAAAWRPDLRDELLFLRRGDHVEAVWDPVVNRRIDLGPVSRALVPLVNGTRTLDELDAAVASAVPGTSRETTEHTLRTLMLMNLVKGSGVAVLARVASAAAAGAHRPVVLEGSRFLCQGSGECCQNYVFGPLSGEDLALLASLDIAGAIPSLAGKPWLTTKRGPDGTEEKYLATEDDRCVFLKDDLRCGLHAAFGADKKPALCRLYPLRYLPTIEGLKVFDSGECATFPVSARSGPSVESELARILPLVPRGLELYHPIVFVAPGTPCDYGHFLRLERKALEVVAARPGSALEALRAVVELANDFALALATCPLREGEPDLTLDRLLARDPRTFTPVEPRPTDVAGRRALGRLADALLAISMKAIVDARPTPRGRDLSVPLHRRFAEIVQIVQALAATTAGDERPELPPYFREVLSVPLESGDVDEALILGLRHALFGDRLLLSGKLGPAVMRLAVVHLATTIGAKLHGLTRGAKTAGVQDLAFGGYLAQRLLRFTGIVQLLGHFEDASWLIAREALALARG